MLYTAMPASEQVVNTQDHHHSHNETARRTAEEIVTIYDLHATITRGQVEFIEMCLKQKLSYREKLVALLSVSALSDSAKIQAIRRLFYADFTTGENSFPSKDTLSEVGGIGLRTANRFDAEIRDYKIANVRRARRRSATYDFISPEALDAILVEITNQEVPNRAFKKCQGWHTTSLIDHGHPDDGELECSSRGAAAISSGRPPRKEPEREIPSSCGKAGENRAPSALRDGDLEDGRENPPAPPPAAGSQEGAQSPLTMVRPVSTHPTPFADLARWLRQSDNDPDGLLSAKLVYPAQCAVLGRLIARHGRDRVISAVLDYTTGGRQPGCEIWWNGGEDRRRGHVVSWTYFEAALGERKAA